MCASVLVYMCVCACVHLLHLSRKCLSHTYLVSKKGHNRDNNLRRKECMMLAMGARLKIEDDQVEGEHPRTELKYSHSFSC